jgi:CRP/FNR family cyclic AMP-dependent transcriptional regulator
MSVVTLEELKKYPILADIDDVYLSNIGQQMQSREYERKQYVVKKGDSAKEVFFLSTGQLQVVDVANDGKEVGLYLINPGTMFGHVTLLDEQTRSSSVIATQDSQVSVMSKQLMLKLFYDYPVVMHRLLVEFAGIIRQTNTSRTVISQANASSRVYSVLVNMMQPNVAGMMTIEKMPRQQEIALMASTSRETVSRAISQLINRSVVEKDLKRLIIRKPDMLKKLAEEVVD